VTQTYVAFHLYLHVLLHDQITSLLVRWAHQVPPLEVFLPPCRQQFQCYDNPLLYPFHVHHPYTLLLFHEIVVAPAIEIQDQTSVLLRPSYSSSKDRTHQTSSVVASSSAVVVVVVVIETHAVVEES
jgi:hypothetical protein